MSLAAILSIWRRRWLLTSLMLALAFLCIAAAVAEIPRSYRAQSLMILLPSHKVAEQVGAGNPYLSFNDSLSTTADALSSTVAGPEVSGSLKSSGFVQPYTVTSESTLSQSSSSGATLPGPFVAIVVTGADKIGVEDTLTEVTAKVSAMLQTMQDGISLSSRISAIPLSVDRTPSLSVSGTARSLVLVAVPFLILALSIPVVVDALRTRSRG